MKKKSTDYLMNGIKNVKNKISFFDLSFILFLLLFSISSIVNNTLNWALWSAHTIATDLTIVLLYIIFAPPIFFNTHKKLNIMTKWIKINEKVPEFNKEVIVKTSKNVYYVALLNSVLTNAQGTRYNWVLKLNIHDDYLDLEKNYGKIIEWCEIPN